MMNTRGYFFSIPQVLVGLLGTVIVMEEMN